MKSFSQFLAEVKGPFDLYPGSKEYQVELDKQSQEKEKQKQQERHQNTTQARTDFRSGGFISGAKGGKSGKFYKNAATGKYSIFVPDNS